MKKIRCNTFTKLILVFAWTTILFKTDSYFSVYLLLSFVSIYSIIKYQNKKEKNTWLEYLFSVIISLFICLANYHIFTNIYSTGGLWNLLTTIFAAIICFVGSVFVTINILYIFKYSLLKIEKNHKKPLKLFLICFFSILIFYSIILVLCCYPGTLTSDSTSEIQQIITNTYNNHHPFYFTILIKPFISLGTNLFGDINAGIFLFSLSQIIILSAAFSYTFLTLYQIGTPKKILIPLIILTIIMPYNILYSFTMWKDVLFGIFFLVFIVSLYRYFKLPPQNKIKFLIYFLIIISGVLICLFRSNGWIAFVATTILFLFIFRKQYIKIGITFCCIVIISFILKTPVLRALNVTQPDIIESLSIPMQQVVRVLVEEKDTLSENNLALISKTIPPERLIEEYNPIIHDPVKKVIRLEGNKQYFEKHIFDYLGLYLGLGFKHPITYIKAWVDQTRGYWNAGNNYWKWSDEIADNDYGIAKTTNSNTAKNILNTYLNIYEGFGFLHPFISIGLMAWILILIIYRNIIIKNKILIFLTLPLLTTWLTLVIATPVYSEFRYAYFMFTSIPFLSIVSFIEKPIRRIK